ncbi:MAG: hypothetical protein OEW12_00500 [Deltaproteobacteria bacterium]|nr:hypothetical protein [Deltaproteobacteria bacterium]
MVLILFNFSMVWGQEPSTGDSDGSARKWASALMGNDVEDRLVTLDKMRAAPKSARLALYQGLREAKPAQRKPLILFMARFGVLDDLPFLWSERLREGDNQGYSQSVAVMHAISGEKKGKTNDIKGMIQKVSFAIQKGSVPYEEDKEGKFTVSSQAFDILQNLDISTGTINRIWFLRENYFASAGEIDAQLRKTLSPRDWRKHGQEIMGMVEMVPKRKKVEGTVITELKNPTSRRLAIRIALDVFWGILEAGGGDRVVVLAPKETKKFEQPVKIITRVKKPPTLLYVRAWEFGSDTTMDSRKLLFSTSQ